MFILSWQLTLLSLGILPFFLYLSQKVGRVRREVSGQTQESLADLTAIMQETLSVSGILLSKAFGRQTLRDRPLPQGEPAALGSRDTQDDGGSRVLRSRSESSSRSRRRSSISSADGCSSRETSAGTGGALVGTIVAFTTLQSRLFFPMGQLLNVNVEVQSGLALFDRIFEYLDLEHDIVDRDGAIELGGDEVKGRVELRRRLVPLRPSTRRGTSCGRSRDSMSISSPGNSSRWWVLRGPVRRRSLI